MNTFPPFDRSYVKEHIESNYSGDYRWMKHYLYPTWYRFNQYNHKPVPTSISNRRLSIKAGPLERRKVRLDYYIGNNLIAARGELQQYYMEKYARNPHSLLLNPGAHYYLFREYLRMARRFHDELVQITTV